MEGVIRYPSQGGKEEKGKLIYVKSTLTADDPDDLHEYKRQHESFPHESTVDQFFDKAQFESYRMLGYRAGRAALEILKKQDLRLGAENSILRS